MRQRSPQGKSFRAPDPSRLDLHEPFVVVLGRIRARSLRWYRCRAGLLVLELLDHCWSTQRRVIPVSVRRRDEVRRAVAAVRPKASRVMLHQVLELAVPGPQPQSEALTALSRYAERLQHEGEFKLAAHVYTLVIHYASQVGLALLVAKTYECLGTCRRECGDFQEAMECYSIGLAGATRCRDEHTKLRIAIARANLHLILREPEEARAMLDPVLLRAKALGAPELVTRAEHEIGGVLHDLGRDEEALVHYAEGFRTCTESRERSRLLNDIALSLEELGFLDEAKDVWLLVFQLPTAEKYARWAAGINLLMLAHGRGDAVSFDQYRRELEPAPMSARLLMNFWLQVGDGSRVLGRPQEEATLAYTRAVEHAERYGLTELKEYERAKQALAGQPLPERRAPTPVSLLPRAVVELLETLRTLRSTPGLTDATPQVTRRAFLQRGRPRHSDVA